MGYAPHMIESVEGFRYTTAIKKLRRMTKRIRIVPGGTSAGKTYGILPILIDTACKTPGIDISVVSETVPHLRKGALKDFMNIMKATNRWIESHYNKTLLTYTFANGSYIEFFSADQESRVRGPRRRVLYINECNNIDFETYHQLAVRTSDVIWLDFNPSAEFWVHTELKDDPDAETLVLTYKDNEALSESIVNELLKAKAKAYFNTELEGEELFAKSNIKNYYWHNYWRVYGLGLVGSLEGIIFTNWRHIEQVPKDAKLIGYTLDFGYTNDPTVLLACYEWQDTYIWDEMLFKAGMKNPDIARFMRAKQIRRTDFVVADSAEPKSIDEINLYGFTVVKADKGRDSIMFGIDTLQSCDWYVTKSSTNLTTELRNYMWDRDETGKVTNKPIENFNHCIDAMRYLATKKWTQKGKRKVRGIKRAN